MYPMGLISLHISCKNLRNALINQENNSRAVTMRSKEHSIGTLDSHAGYRPYM